MKIIKTQNGETLNVALEGRLDTQSAPQLRKVLAQDLSETTGITFDFANLEYISSAGLRVLIETQRGMKLGGRIKVVNANNIVKEVFNATGVSSFISIE